MGTSLKGKNSLQEGANSFLKEQFLMVLKIIFYQIRWPPLNVTSWMLLFLLRTCVMAATPMTAQVSFFCTFHALNTFNLLLHNSFPYLSRDMRFLRMRYVRPAKPQTSLRIRAVWSEPLLVACVFYECSATDWASFSVSKLKMRLHRLVWVYTCQMPHCWKSHVTAHLLIDVNK